MDELDTNSVNFKLYSYFHRRRHLSHNVREAHVDEEDDEVDREIEKATCLPGAATADSVIVDLVAAEQQFTMFAAWISSLKQQSSTSSYSDLVPFLGPLLVHLYLDCLPVHPKPAVLRLFKTFSSHCLNDEWSPFVEQLLSLRNPLCYSSAPLVQLFRETRLEVRLLPDSLIILKKFLRAKSLDIIIQILQSWFQILVVTDDIINSDEDSTDATTVEVKQEINQESSEDEANEDLEDFMREINEKRLQPTPPPPLLLYTAHKTDGIVCGQVSDGCKLMATGDMRSEVRIWGLGETKLAPQLHENYFSSFPLSAYNDAFNYNEVEEDGKGESQSGDLTEESKARCKDMIARQLWPLRGHSDTVYDVAFIPGSEYLLSVSFDTTMRLWNLTDFSCSVVYRGHSSPIWGVAVSPLPNMVATASHDKTARVWSLERTFPLRIMAGHQEDVTVVAFHPNGTYLATGSPDKSARLWSVTDGLMVRVFAPTCADALAFSPNGQFLATAGDDCVVSIWDIKAGTVFSTLTGHTSRIISMDWSADGSTLSAASFDGLILLWSLDSSEACTGPVTPRTYLTNCTTLLSLRYSYKNSLIAAGLSNASSASNPPDCEKEKSGAMKME